MPVTITWLDEGHIALVTYSGQLSARDALSAFAWIEGQLARFPGGFHAINDVTAVTGADIGLMHPKNVPPALRIFPRLKYMAVVFAGPMGSQPGFLAGQRADPIGQAHIIGLNFILTLWQSRIPNSLFQQFLRVEDAATWLRAIQEVSAS